MFLKLFLMSLKLTKYIFAQYFYLYEKLTESAWGGQPSVRLNQWWEGGKFKLLGLPSSPPLLTCSLSFFYFNITFEENFITKASLKPGVDLCKIVTDTAVILRRSYEPFKGSAERSDREQQQTQKHIVIEGLARLAPFLQVVPLMHVTMLSTGPRLRSFFARLRPPEASGVRGKCPAYAPLDVI